MWSSSFIVSNHHKNLLLLMFYGLSFNYITICNQYQSSQQNLLVCTKFFTLISLYAVCVLSSSINKHQSDAIILKLTSIQSSEADQDTQTQIVSQKTVFSLVIPNKLGPGDQDTTPYKFCGLAYPLIDNEQDKISEVPISQRSYRSNGQVYEL